MAGPTWMWGHEFAEPLHFSLLEGAAHPDGMAAELSHARGD